MLVRAERGSQPAGQERRWQMTPVRCSGQIRHQALRRVDGQQRHLALTSLRRRDPVGDRAERGGEVHPFQADRRVRHAGADGRSDLQGARRSPACRRTRWRGGGGADLPGDDDLQVDEPCAKTSSSRITCGRGLAPWVLLRVQGQAKADEADFGKSADDIIDFLGLQAIRNEMASNLPQGHLRGAWHGHRARDAARNHPAGRACSRG